MAVEESRNRTVSADLEAIAATAVDGVIITDDHGRIITANDRIHGMLGHTSGSLVGRDVAETVIPPEFRDAHLAAMRRFRETGTGKVVGSRVELRALHADGSEIPVELGLSSLDSGQRRLFVGFLRDLSEEVRHRTELAAEAKKVEDASAAKSRFVQMLAHDIRTPLGGLIGCIQLLDTARLADSDLKVVETARTAAQSMAVLLDDALDLVRIEAGELSLKSKPSRIATLIEDHLSLWRESARSKGLNLGAQIDNQVPEVLELDPVRVSQVLNNLLSNALKYTDRGGIEVRLNYHDAGTLGLAVADTGIGLGGQESSDLLQPFVSGQRSGAGLGLSITNAVVRAMGGHFTIAAGENGGTVATVEIPAPRSSDTENPTADVKAGTALAGYRVLLAEDNETNQFVARAMLENLGASVTIAPDGVAALEALDGAEFDLILMDIDMPRLDGIETIKRIRAGDGPASRTPIIALTAYAFEHYRNEVEKAGGIGTITKPILGAEELAANVRALLASAASQPATTETSAGEPRKTATNRLDMATVSTLRSALGEAEFATLSTKVVSDIERCARDIMAGVRESDPERARRAIHVLTSVSATIGATELLAATEALRRALQDDDADAQRANVEQIERLSREAIDAVNDL